MASTSVDFCCNCRRSLTSSVNGRGTPELSRHQNKIGLRLHRHFHFHDLLELVLHIVWLPMLELLAEITVQVFS